MNMYLVSHTYLVDWGPGRSQYPKKQGMVIADTEEEALEYYKKICPPGDMSYRYKVKPFSIKKGEVYMIK